MRAFGRYIYISFQKYALEKYPSNLKWCVKTWPWNALTFVQMFISTFLALFKLKKSNSVNNTVFTIVYITVSFDKDKPSELLYNSKTMRPIKSSREQFSCFLGKRNGTTLKSWILCWPNKIDFTFQINVLIEPSTLDTVSVLTLSGEWPKVKIPLFPKVLNFGMIRYIFK